MKAVGKYIVIDPIKEVDTTTKGGLILAEKQREDIRYRRAKVIEPGSDVSVLKKGDEVYYDKSAGFNICLLYTSPSPRDGLLSRMPSSA